MINSDSMKSVKKSVLFTLSFAVCAFTFSQEALKSLEEEYYDFLSLQGIVERPTLGYRTLSDSEWNFIEKDEPVFDENGNPVTEKRSQSHPWQNNNLGTKRTLWQSENQGGNWFTRGLDHSLKLKIYGPEWYNSYNTAAPYGQNDGALWQGKGYNTSLTGGARLEGYGFEVTVKPQVSFSQNLSFDYLTGTVNEYGYFWGHIDTVQRYGDSAFWTYDWGDTEVRWGWRTFTVGFGWQNPWLGPALLNPMLGSNNAGSYPKLDLGLRKTAVYLPFCNWYIGDIEGRIWTGMLTESVYYDNDSSNDKRMVNGISASYAPSFIPGLTIGVNRVFVTYWRSENFKYIGRLFTLSHSNALSSSGNDEDQKVALNLDWKFPKVGFEVYGELGLDDFTSHELANPFHTAIYTVGAKQIIPLPFSKISQKFSDLKSELIFEWNNFEMSQDFQMQWAYMGYYGHGFVSQGYTQNGQILGAGTGSAGNSQYIAWKIYFPKGYFMPYFHRHSPDNNYIYSMSVHHATAADAYSDPINQQYYGIFKTYRTIGADAGYYITKDFRLEAGFSVIYVNYPLYDKYDAGYLNYRGTMAIKYQL